MPYHTLAVDDDPIFIMLMERMLAKTDDLSDFSKFENGLDALNHLKQEYMSHDKFVVFLDINMPTMDGWEFLDELESFAEADKVWVFLCTSSVDDSDVNRGKQYKFVRDFLSKPIYLNKLREVEKELNDNF